MKLKKHCEILFRPMKNYFDKIFVEKSRSIKSSDYSNHTCVNNAYQNFCKFSQKVDSVTPIRTIIILSPIQNREKYYKKIQVIRQRE